jgi:hypothetical protein
MAAPPGQATRALAAWAIAGRPLPPLALPACGLAQSRRACVAAAGSMPPPPLAAGGPCRHRHWRQVGHAATPTGGRWQGGACRHPHWRQVAGRGHAATPNGGRDTCRLPRGCRHPQLVLFDKKFRRGSFLAFHSRRWSDPSKIRESRPCAGEGRGSRLSWTAASRART